MTVPTTIDVGAWPGKYLMGGDVDQALPRVMSAAFADALMSAQASMQCGAGYNERSDEGENSRNGYRTRPWDMRVGTINLAVPKLRQDVYSLEFLLRPRRRAEQAVVAVICQAYVEGVSTRRVDDLVKAMGIEGIHGPVERARSYCEHRSKGGRNTCPPHRDVMVWRPNYAGSLP
ncbi:MAG: transposase [Acidimicrobiales bacterium]